MSKTLDEAIEELVADISRLDTEMRKKKETVNTLCAVNHRPPLYKADDTESSTLIRIRPDLFYGQALATAVRTILEMRRQQDMGAASINEIYDTLTNGGYQFQTKTEDVAKASLRSSLSKNNLTFHKLPNGRFGLLSWYPNVRQGKATATPTGNPDEPSVEEPENETAATDTSAAAA
jgi:hypothetical protein